MAYVLDCSMAIAWQFRDESDALSDRALHAIKAAGAIVPQLWPYEIANALVVAERRGRITAPDVLDILSSLADLPITTEDRAAAPSELAEIARRQGISAYDAAYLELASRARQTLATRDQRLAAAAARRGVAVIGLMAP